MMTHDSTMPTASTRPRRSRLQRGCLGALTLLILLALTVGGFEYNAWHGEVDSYTYVARGDHDQVIAQVISHDAKAVSALRQRINAKPILPPPAGPNMGCTLIPNSPITVTSYRYAFYSGGRAIETVASDNLVCGAAAASCGGVTIWIGDMRPPLPTTNTSTSSADSSMALSSLR